MKVASKVRFADAALKKTYERLKEESENELHTWLERAFDDIEENAFCGIQIPKKRIPRSYVKKHIAICGSTTCPTPGGYFTRWSIKAFSSFRSSWSGLGTRNMSGGSVIDE